MASLGQALREEREARNISIEEIASATKIGSRYLEALEKDRFDLMPGGFFIKGIIRTYARAIGLDEDEVLARYKAAGLIGEAADKRHSYMRPAAEPSQESGQRPPAEPISPAGTTPTPAARTATRRVIELPPRIRLSPAARKRILTWTWRSAAAVLTIVVLVAVWSSLRPRPPRPQAGIDVPASGTVAAQAALPAPQKIEPLSEPSSEPASEPALKPPAAVEEDWKGVSIEISFQAETWIQVYADGVRQIDGLFPAGSSARAQADELILMHVGNAGGFTFLLNGKPAKPLGRTGQVLTDIKITPNNYKEFLEIRPPGQPAG
jgi:transcriptional regulator with XRE-family HTH domain